MEKYKFFVVGYRFKLYQKLYVANILLSLWAIYSIMEKNQFMR